MKIFIQNQQDKVDVDQHISKIIEESIVNTIKVFLEEENFEISVLIVDNNFIKELNKNYRNVNKETDVLSFPIFEFKNGKLLEDIVIMEDEIPLGDIVISIEKAAQQAEEFGHSLEREVAYLTVHSVLHLLGFDHIEDDDRKVMREYEEQILQSMGLTR
ncbi:rRNA maturation RNase YbeY [Caldicellulosiruptor acetigenus]|uniref:Endoribonuclease YbeY n=1 Tax=Caldicellulosiruptor acetigenus 6A TaxID=632516 RepID=G2PTC3_9FIRM|nr:rRNA maturation RNase YbeY [Caldicellulosiruptor acetigenus]AEM73314.1 metalloprotease ybeY [Caldicellulosiruptor acetigenus 6A]WAM35136.1 rRNA maturation RNase YbeY [Caldicellulosiruptor acetigenus]